jgi:hypothetical protein
MGTWTWISSFSWSCLFRSFRWLSICISSIRCRWWWWTLCLICSTWLSSSFWTCLCSCSSIWLFRTITTLCFSSILWISFRGSWICRSLAFRFFWFWISWWCISSSSRCSCSSCWCWSCRISITAILSWFNIFHNNWLWFNNWPCVLNTKLFLWINISIPLYCLCLIWFLVSLLFLLRYSRFWFRGLLD